MKMLKSLRSERKISQQKLADSLGVSRSTVAMWETNASEPDNDLLIKISEYFDVSTDYLLGKTEQKKPATESGNGQLKECIVLHRDGKTQTYKFTQKQLDLIAEMIEQIGGEKVDL